MITRKEESKSAKSVLLEDFNDIDVYVEDTALESKKIYKQILNRVFIGQYNIDDVIPVGSCNKVVSEWAKHKKNNDNRPKVFIIDGDFIHFNKNLETIVPEEFKNDLSGLYVLPRYCIENYLIDEDAFIEVIHDEDAVDERDDIKSKIDFNGWVEANEKLLADLFIVYSVCLENNVPEKTISYKVTNFVGSVAGCVESNLIKNRIDHLKQQILIKNNGLDVDAEIQKRADEIYKCNQILLKFITGKNYLFPLIKQRISEHYNFPVTQISLKIRLAKRCKLDELEGLKGKIM